MRIRKIASILVIILLLVAAIAVAYLKGKADGYKVKTIDHGMESYIALMIEKQPDRQGEGLRLIEANLYRLVYIAEELDSLSFLSIAAMAHMNYKPMKERYYDMVRRYHQQYPEGYYRLFETIPDRSFDSVLETTAEAIQDEAQRQVFTQLTDLVNEPMNEFFSEIDEQTRKEKIVIDRVLGLDRNAPQP